MTTVRCPHCSTPVPWGPQSPYRPFCSKRCRLIDLGDWLNGSNHIPGSELDASSLDRLEIGDDPANEDALR